MALHHHPEAEAEAMAEAMIDLLWEKEKDNLYMSKEEFIDSLKDWTITAHIVDGVTVGIVVQRGPEFHFTTFDAKWNLTKTDIRNYLLPLIEQYGFVKTRTPTEDIRQQRFNKLLGFVPDGGDEFFNYYRLEKLRRSILCQL